MEDSDESLASGNLETRVLKEGTNIGMISSELKEELDKLRIYNNVFLTHKAGLPTFPRNFTRDGIISSILMQDANMLKGQILFSGEKQGKVKNPLTGEEPGKIFHEYPGVELKEKKGLTTEYNACDTTALYLIGHEIYQKLTQDNTLAKSQKENMRQAVEYIKRHINEEGAFIEDPEFANAKDFALEVTYWKDYEKIAGRENGEKIGIVGRSGCGKSTLTKLLLGLYKIRSGGIYIDGININKFKHSSITDTITAVLQDSEMFDMTLAENISISTMKKDDELLKKSVGISALDEVISKLPKKLSTLLGEKGYKVSGGERQRIGIARAIYKNSPVLILDEATSHLDSKTEKHIQDHLEKELKNKTLIVIAHRFSTLKNVDRILVMEKGKVVEQGKFNDLVKKREKFFSLYKLQKRNN